MLGAFFAYMAVVSWGVDYWVGFLIAIVVIAAFGAVLDMTVLRRVIGQPQFAVVMLTIGLGAMFRTFASVTWGSEIYTLPTPFSGVTNIAGVTLSHQYLSIIAGTLILCGVLFAFFKYTRIGIAMQATSQNQLAAYYVGIPVKLIFSLVWAISAAVATAAGILLAPVTLIDINMGLAVALKAFAAAVLGGFGSIPGALVGGITIGLIELYAGATLPEGFKDTAPYIVLLVMLAVRPQGLFGTLGGKKVWRRAHALRVQDLVRAGRPSLPRRCYCHVVRIFGSRDAAAAKSVVELLCWRDYMGLYLRHLRRLAYGPGGLHRAAIVGPRRLSRD